MTRVHDDMLPQANTVLEMRGHAITNKAEEACSTVDSDVLR